MPAQLLALSDGPNILLDKPILLFGRHPECDVQLNSRKISRRHCCVAQVGERLLIRDLGSTNGVRINGERVVEGPLNAGDELTIGNFRYEVCTDLTNASAKSKQVPVEDDMLESSDEPIALAEPKQPIKAPAGKKVAPKVDEDRPTAR
jgi:pSer/pThr/pTyr-binding forkhead associated (FHA) protein